MFGVLYAPSQHRLISAADVDFQRLRLLAINAIARAQNTDATPGAGRLELITSTGSSGSSESPLSLGSSRGGSTVTVVSPPASTEPPEFIAPLDETVTSILQFLRGWLSDAVALRSASVV